MACKSLRCIRFEDYVCRRIVGSRIHRVGSVECTRGRKTNIVNGEVSDLDWHRSVSITPGLALLTRCTPSRQGHYESSAAPKAFGAGKRCKKRRTRPPGTGARRTRRSL